MQNDAQSAGKKVGLLTEVVRNVRLAWRLFRDPRVSGATKLIIPGLAVAYLLFPADLLPDVIPGLGQLDDLALIALGIKLFVDTCPQWLVQAHRDGLTGKGSAQTAQGAQAAKSGHTGETVDGEYRVID